LIAAKDAAEQKKHEAATKIAEAEQTAASLSDKNKNYDLAITNSQTELLKQLRKIKPAA
jgi:hypothetical protein